MKFSLILAMFLMGLAPAGCEDRTNLDWGPWWFDENIVVAVSDAGDSAKAERLAACIDCISIKQLADKTFRQSTVRQWMVEPDVYTTRDHAQIVRIINGLASDGSKNASNSMAREELHTLVLLFDRTLMRYGCIYAFETRDDLHWLLASAQEAGNWTSKRAESTLTGLGVVHSQGH